MTEEINLIRVKPVGCRILPQKIHGRNHVLNIVGQQIVPVTAPDTPIGEHRHRKAVGPQRLSDVQILVTAGVTVEHYHYRAAAFPVKEIRQ